MQESKTHHIKAPCGKFTMHITEAGEDIIIDVDKSGSCRSVLFEILAKLITELGRTKAVAILKGYKCESAVAGSSSCADKIAKVLSVKEEK
jgi:hypothetical protein